MPLTFHSAAVFIAALTVIKQKVDGTAHILTPGTSPTSPFSISLGYTPDLCTIFYAHMGVATHKFALLMP